MKFILSILIFGQLFFFVSCTSNSDKEKNATENKRDSVGNNASTRINFLITERSFGNIDSATDFEQLQKTFGVANVRDTIDFGPEGSDSLQITKVYSNTPKEISVMWKPGNFHKHISAAECFRESAPYYTTDSLKIGSTLAQLLNVNGKKINFYGTGWDYGGLITSYNMGKFDSSTIFFRLSGKEGMDPALMGDKELNTDMPPVRNNLQKVVIGKISVSFEKNAK